MSGGGSKTPAATPYTVDPAQLAQFVQSGAGKAYASQYNPTNSYVQVGSSYHSYTSGTSTNPLQNSFINTNPNWSAASDVTGLMTAYQSWLTGQQQTQTNWNNYTALANANEGGEGAATITAGAAASLGSLANAGVSTTPTPGLGSFGTTGMPALGGKA